MPERCRGTKRCPMAGWDKNGGDSDQGTRWACQNGISDGQKDGCNRGRFLYSDRKINRGREAVRCQHRGWEEEGWM